MIHKNTFNRGKLKRLAAAGRLEMVESYHYDEMDGTAVSRDKHVPVVYPRPTDWHDRKEGTLYLDDFDFSTKSGCSYPSGITAAGDQLVNLTVHGNLHYTFRVLPEVANLELPKPMTGTHPLCYCSSLPGSPCDFCSGIRVGTLDNWRTLVGHEVRGKASRNLYHVTDVREVGGEYVGFLVSIAEPPHALASEEIVRA